MDWCTVRRDITEITLKTALNTIQTIYTQNYFISKPPLICRLQIVSSWTSLRLCLQVKSHSATFDMLSANGFDLDKCKTLSSGKESFSHL